MRNVISRTAPVLLAGLVGLCACQPKAAPIATAATDCCTGKTIYEDPDLTTVPKFPGGDAAMYAWLGNRLTKPAAAAEVKEGPLVQFNVNCDGKLSEIAVKVAAHPEMDSLAVKAVREMPTWIPGKIKDKVVCTFHVITVNFD